MTLFNTTKPVGIDVSYWDVGTGDPIDWAQVSNHVTFAICKLTEGWSYPSNPETKAKLKANLVGAKKAGLQVGAYHFFIASLDPIKQADNFIKAITESGVKLDIPPVVDIERHPYYSDPSREVAITNIRKFLKKLEAEYGIKPMIYTSDWWWNPVIGTTNWANDYLLWVASYVNDPQGDLDSMSPRIPFGWTDYKFWQFTSNAEFPGVFPSREDANVFNGTLAELKAFCGITEPVIDTSIETELLHQLARIISLEETVDNFTDMTAEALDKFSVRLDKVENIHARINDLETLSTFTGNSLTGLLERIAKAKAEL